MRVILLIKNLGYHKNLKERLANEKWTTEETLMLINAIEKYSENWDEIAKVLNII